MQDEDVRADRPVAHVIGEDLAAVSVAELEARIALLGAEIERVRAEIGRKTASREAAAAVFRR